MTSRSEPYELAAAALVKASGVTVRRYRQGSTGTAYTRSEDWGIEAPKPRGPVSFAVFAHEVGHQRLHRVGRRPRWLEEVEAWEFALRCFDGFGLAGVEQAREAAGVATRYSLAKAVRRRCSPETARLGVSVVGPDDHRPRLRAGRRLCAVPDSSRGYEAADGGVPARDARGDLPLARRRALAMGFLKHERSAADLAALTSRERAAWHAEQAEEILRSAKGAPPQLIGRAGVHATLALYYRDEKEGSA